MKKLLVMFAALGSLAAFGATSQKDAAQKSLDQVQAAFNARDASKLSKIFAPDATLVLPEGRTVHGRSAIQKEMTKEFGKQFKDAQSKFTLDGTRTVGDRAVWVDATHTLTNFTKPDGTKGPMTFHLTALLEKRGDQWLATEARPYAFEQPQTQGTGGSGK
jgi:uncharacterized protein (TIGR02246 family)